MQQIPSFRREKQNKTRQKTTTEKNPSYLNYWKLKPKEPGQKLWGKRGRTVQIRKVRGAVRKLCPEVVNTSKQNNEQQNVTFNAESNTSKFKICRALRIDRKRFSGWSQKIFLNQT